MLPGKLCDKATALLMREEMISYPATYLYAVIFRICKVLCLITLLELAIIANEER